MNPRSTRPPRQMMREAIGQVGARHRLRKQAGNPAPEDELRRAGCPAERRRGTTASHGSSPDTRSARTCWTRSPAVSAVARRPAGKFLRRARWLVLAGGDAAIAAHLLDVPVEDIQHIAGGVDKRHGSPARSRTRADDLLVQPNASCMMSWISARLGDDLVLERLSTALNRTQREPLSCVVSRLVIDGSGPRDPTSP